MKEIPAHAKRIVFVSTIYGARWGGSEELWSQTALCLARAGVGVFGSVQESSSEVNRIRELREAGCQVRPRAARREIVAKLSRRFMPARNWKWIGGLRPDLAVISNGGTQIQTDLIDLCAAHGIRYALIFHSATDVGEWPSDESVAENRPRLERAAKVYCVSKANRAVVQRQYSLDAKNFEVVRNPFQVSFDANPPWPSSDDPISLACVGRLEPGYKGQDVLIELLAQPKWRSRPVELVFYGHGKNQGCIERLIKKHGVSNIRLGGQVGDIESLWSRHHALVLASRLEGLPIVIVEAMLCGRPCIVSDVAGNAEFIEDGVTGFVAEAPTVKSFDTAMERAWQEKSRWREIGAAAQQRIRSEVPSNPAAVFAESLLSLCR